MTYRIRCRATLIAAAVIATGSFVQAQTVTLDGAFLIGRDARDPRLPTGVFGLAGGVSAYPGQCWTLGLEADWPRTRSYDKHSDSTTVLGVRSVGDSHNTFQGTVIALTSGWRFRPRPRLTVTPLVGFGIERRQLTSSGTFDLFDAQGALVRHDQPTTSSTFNWASMPVGVDVAFDVNSRIAVTSQWRLYLDPFFFVPAGCCDGLQVQARLGVRWSF